MNEIFIVERNGDTLSHHGTKGQKWGVRRYQNPDGTRTPLGKRLRNSYNEKKENLASNYKNPLARNIKQKNGPNTSIAEQSVRNAGSAIDSAKNINDVIIDMRKSAKVKDKKLKKMTDQEIRDEINRMNLEQKYRQLKSNDVGKGQQYLSDTLEIVGSMVGITSGVVGIMAGIYALKKEIKNG